MRAVVLHEDKLLLVHEATDGRWSLPGGWIDLGDSLSRAAVREVREESGYDVKAVKLISVSNVAHRPDGRRTRINLFRLVVQCELISEEPGPIQGAETTEARFFSVDELPALSPARVRPADLERVLEHRLNPGRPADFD